MKHIETHPCFTASCGDYARIHLPVAPACNLQCNYCLRKFSCANENRPGVTAKVMTPQDALAWYLKMKSRVPKLTVAGIAGPGEALANWTNVAETLRLIRSADEDVLFCLSTNGLYLPEYARLMVELGVDYVTVTINASDADIGAKVYSYIDYHGTNLKGRDAAALLLKNQLEGLSILMASGVNIKINTVAIPGINMQDVPNVARLAADYGCRLQNILPMLPIAGTKFGEIKEATEEEILRLRISCRKYIPQMLHCNRCRADAVGALVNPCCYKRESKAVFSANSRLLRKS